GIEQAGIELKQGHERRESELTRFQDRIEIPSVVPERALRFIAHEADDLTPFVLDEVKIIQPPFPAEKPTFDGFVGVGFHVAALGLISLAMIFHRRPYLSADLMPDFIGFSRGVLTGRLLSPTNLLWTVFCCHAVLHLAPKQVRCDSELRGMSRSQTRQRCR